MPGTRVEALSRSQVQAGIQKDLFAKAEAHLNARRAKVSGKTAPNMRGLQYAPDGFPVPGETDPVPENKARLVAIALIGFAVGAFVLG
ncbi:hypothetical protein TRP8649_02412 [Pelagimonas phthalicica]|uniref:Uncharacterized protein n=1 Tax=Pelagimonas phthalicica TaxID=1037362 RepID=A0A238JEM8_9RHOB|nr:hypothetical protein [Pelagimonas phthalicica]TDS91248.1 hypothetical protein CLV87_2414 [Pelagimonas phthalicica]SMX28296.1 hypothetical protein TRP8649_02412 [Pelagimonas phthalicica]